MAELEGKTLDHYELRKLTGRGGMADVYKGYDRYFQREVAVKVFKREDDELLRRFIREANVMASLSNEHLVPIYGSGECQVDGIIQYYIVMPFMEGGTLRARVRRTPFSLAQACECLQEIAEGLDYIHSQGIIHRDIKSSNVLLDADGRYYLSDFGVARMTTDVTQLTSTGNVLGTVDYIAPELFEGNRKADALTDLYSLGVLLFEMVTGRLPFHADNQIAVVAMHVNKPPPSPRSINKNISPQVERVILKALEKKPERRYQSAIELADAFCSALAAGNTRGVGVQERQPEAVGSVSQAETVPNAVAPVVVKPAPTPTINRGATPPEMPPSPTINRDTCPPGRVPTVAPPFMVGVGSGSGRPLGNRQVERGLQRRSRPASPARQRTVVVTVLALLILLVLAIPAIYAATHRSNFAPGTAGAIAQARATAQAIATAGVLQTATAGTPIYQDTLTDATNSSTMAAYWDQNSHCTFMSDGYHVMEGVNTVGLHGCRESANTYDNTIISVDVRILSGHSGGLFFRLSVDPLKNYSGYLFEIDSQGNYKISDFSSKPYPLQNWSASSALNKGNATNTLLVIAQGNALLFYANGVLLTAVNDNTYTSGYIAFLATSTDTSADVAYSNLKVYQLS